MGAPSLCKRVGHIDCKEDIRSGAQNCSFQKCEFGIVCLLPACGHQAEVPGNSKCFCAYQPACNLPIKADIGKRTSWAALRRILAREMFAQGEFPDVKSIDEAFHKCATTSGCSHFTVDFVGSRSTPTDKQRLVLWSVI